MRRVLVALGVGALVLAGCADHTAERQGKELGQAVCDVRNAPDRAAANAALARARQSLADGLQTVGRPLGDGAKQLEDQLGLLATSVGDGNRAAAQQDVNAVKAEARTAIEGSTDRVQAYFDGVGEALADCD